MSKSGDPEDQLRSFIEKFEPQHQAIIRAARKKLRKRFPRATELVYGNYNFLVIGFGPNNRPSDCMVTIAPLPHYASNKSLEPTAGRYDVHI